MAWLTSLRWPCAYPNTSAPDLPSDAFETHPLPSTAINRHPCSGPRPIVGGGRAFGVGLHFVHRALQPQRAAGPRQRAVDAPDQGQGTTNYRRYLAAPQLSLTHPDPAPTPSTGSAYLYPPPFSAWGPHPHHFRRRGKGSRPPVFIVALLWTPCSDGMPQCLEAVGGQFCQTRSVLGLSGRFVFQLDMSALT